MSAFFTLVKCSGRLLPALLTKISNREIFLRIFLNSSIFVTSQTKALLEPLVFLIILLTSFVLLSKWFYTSCKLNHLNGMKGLNTSPRWAWLWYAIPIANLFKPYQSLKETYQASTQRDDWKEISIPWAFPIWWMSYLSSSFASNISFRLFSNLTEDSPYQDYVTEHYVAFTGEFLWVVSAIALLQIVKTVSVNQSKLNFQIKYTEQGK